MKKIFAMVLAAGLVFSAVSLAQDMGGSMSNDKAAAAMLKTLKGTVKADGDKLTFVSDKDQKSWDIMNPETLKSHDGHHVQLSAHVYTDKNAIHVMSVKMLK